MSEKNPGGIRPKIADLLDRDDRNLGGSKRTQLSSINMEEEEFQSAVADLKDEIAQIRVTVSGELNKSPLLRLAIRSMEKLVDEYDRLDQIINDYHEDMEDISDNARSGERSRIRDNMTSLIIERWRLLNAISDNVHRVHTAMSKVKDIVVDPFEEFMNGTVGEDGGMG